ncbi:hypothetical protein NPIL_565201 [Nephila pilipes]|uniref:Uncharacterized protein n=1 Tax=Nephila pilipes TaxID=299642 RepID=A0A8X6UWJ8_NEPPI|nr:hypothetical protein NPIL_565201 [Nephila pilipes]
MTNGTCFPIRNQKTLLPLQRTTAISRHNRRKLRPTSCTTLSIETVSYRCRQGSHSARKIKTTPRIPPLLRFLISARGLAEDQTKMFSRAF